MMRFIKMALALAALTMTGCIYTGCKSNTPGPVHPTDEQIDNASPGESSKDPPYTPWWAELNPF